MGKFSGWRIKYKGFYLLPLPDSVEKLLDAGFIAERSFGIISTLMKPAGHECG
jgi:hypothetical protein